MKRNDMILDIASELICGELNFPSWDKAQIVAEYILKRVEKEGMTPPLFHREIDDDLLGKTEVAFRRWEPEDG